MKDYKMNPETDRVLLGESLENGMLVLPGSGPVPYDDPERKVQFRRVTQLYKADGRLSFVGVWPDGFEEVHPMYGLGTGWVVKRDSAPPADTEKEALREQVRRLKDVIRNYRDDVNFAGMKVIRAQEDTDRVYRLRTGK